MAKPALYSYFRSSCSWRVRIALAIKKIDYEYRAVHLVKDGGEQHTEKFKEINPVAQIPALVIDGHTLIQSLPIIEYLDETRPENPILPKDPFARAQVRALAETINAGIQPIQNLVVLKEIGEKNSKSWANHWITEGFQGLEKLLAKTSGKYCFGDSVTLADLCLVPQVYNGLKRFDVDLLEFPTISRIYEELLKLEEFCVSHPSKQPDCPPELRSA